MIDPQQLRIEIVRPVLKRIGAHSDAAEDLLLGTAAVESQCGRYLRQLGGGPALGIYQMEPATAHDIVANYLRYRPELSTAVYRLVLIEDGHEHWLTHGNLAGNLYYATALTRVHYLRVPEALPPSNHPEALGVYWKEHYNTHAGAGTVEQFVDTWQRYVAPQLDQQQ